MASLLLQLPPLRSHAFVAPGVGDEGVEALGVEAGARPIGAADDGAAVGGVTFGVADELSLPVELAAGRAFSLAPQAASSTARAEPRIFIVASYGQGEASIFDVG